MIDHILNYSSQAAAKAASEMAPYLYGSNWKVEEIEAGITALRISTATTVTGFFCLISLPRIDSALINAAAMYAVCDRNNGETIAENTGGLIDDLGFYPMFAGSRYPMGLESPAEWL